MRQLANQFAAEASIPIHSLLYTDANPASADALEALVSSMGGDEGVQEEGEPFEVGK